MEHINPREVSTYCHRMYVSALEYKHHYLGIEYPFSGDVLTKLGKK